MIKKISEYLKKKRTNIIIFTVFLMTLTFPMVTFALSPEWQVVYDKLKPWVTRAGLLIFVIGAIDLGVAYNQENPEPRVKGVAKMVGGAALLAVYNAVIPLFNL